MLLKNKVILIAGAAGKLGSVLVDKVLQQGALVVAVDLSVDILTKKLGQEHKHLQFHETDFTDEEQTMALFAKLPQLDGAVNCTYPRGPQYGTSVAQLSMAAFNETVSLHLGAAYLFCQQATAYFQQHQKPLSLVNLSSVYGLVAPKFELYQDTKMTMPVEYAAIKSAIIHLNRYFTKYVRSSDFRVNSVSPGGIADNQPDVFQQKYLQHTCGTGMLQAEDVCGPVIFLLSDLARYVNGQNIVVDDGFTL